MAAAPPNSRDTWFAAVGLVVLVSACGGDQTPEAQVRAVIESGKEAAEARDLSALMDLVSPEYRDDDGRDRAS